MKGTREGKGRECAERGERVGKGEESLDLNICTGTPSSQLRHMSSLVSFYRAACNADAV